MIALLDANLFVPTWIMLLLYKKNSIISPHAKDFIDMVKEYYRNLEEKKIKA